MEHYPPEEDDDVVSLPDDVDDIDEDAAPDIDPLIDAAAARVRDCRPGQRALQVRRAIESYRERAALRQLIDDTFSETWDDTLGEIWYASGGALSDAESDRLSK